MKVERNFTAPAHPVAPRLAAGWVAGVALVQQLHALPGAWVCAALGLGAILAARRRRFMAAALLSGLLWATGYSGLRGMEQLPGAARLSAVVEGVVLDLPKPMVRGVRFDLGVTRWPEAAPAHPPHKLRLSWYDAAAAPKAGETWRFRVSLRRPHGLANPGGFDYEQWLFAEGIRALGYVRKSTDNQRLAAGGWLSPRVWRQSVSDQLAATLADSPRAGLVKALTLGADEDIAPRQWRVLRRTGTAHLIAVSGSHIGLVAALVFFPVQWLCARLGIKRWPPPRIAAGAGLVAALLYSALAGFSIPTQRAALMVAVAMGAVMAQRHTDPLHVLAVALVAVTLYDPLAVLAPGFWLSFGAVALIAYVLGGRIALPRARPPASPAKTDPARPAPGAWAAALKRRLAQSRPAIANLLVINWATALGLAPVLLACFRQVPLVSPLANLLAVPVLGTLLVPLCLFGALLLPVWPTAGADLLHLADRILAGLWPLLETLADWSWAQWNSAEPPFWTIPPALLGTLLLLAPRGIPARWLGLILLLPILTARPERLAPGAFRLAVLDVGQGLAAVVETRHRALVFDTGAWLGPDFDMGQAVVEPYLRHHGLDAIDALIVSHGDNDHSGGARSLLEMVKVAATYTSVPERLPALAATACRAGQTWTWDGVEFAMLGPATAAVIKGNDNSCVLRVRGRGGTALLTGDIERDGEQRLVEQQGGELRSDLLVVPHHGSNTSSGRGFLAAVRPRHALIASGYLNRFGFPHPAVLERYRDIGAGILNTAEAGAILAEVGNGGNGIRPLGWRPASRRYWHDWRER